MRVLNLYSGIGGNRKLWRDVEVTAVEKDEHTAEVYEYLYPDDDIVIDDAHEYLLNHFQEFDFIWSSPPCPTHSVTNNFLHSQGNIRYPDMRLWQEIVFLKKWYKGRWCVENVVSYYEPLYNPTQIDRHYYWSNFRIPKIDMKRDFNIANARASTRQDNDLSNLTDYHGIELPGWVKNKRLKLRNCVHPKMGKHILDMARGIIQKSNTKQTALGL